MRHSALDREAVSVSFWCRAEEFRGIWASRLCCKVRKWKFLFYFINLFTRFFSYFCNLIKQYQLGILFRLAGALDPEDDTAC